MSEQCPKCGQFKIPFDTKRVIRFGCGSEHNLTYDIWRHTKLCRVVELEAELTASRAECERLRGCVNERQGGCRGYKSEGREGK